MNDSEWVKECANQIRQNVDGKYQAYLLTALELFGAETPIKKDRYLYGPMKGKIRRQFCGNCGHELVDPCARYCSSCGRKLPLNWQATWDE